MWVLNGRQSCHGDTIIPETESCKKFEFEQIGVAYTAT